MEPTQFVSQNSAGDKPRGMGTPLVSAGQPWGKEDSRNKRPGAKGMEFECLSEEFELPLRRIPTGKIEGT